MKIEHVQLFTFSAAANFILKGTVRQDMRIGHIQLFITSSAVATFILKGTVGQKMKIGHSSIFHHLQSYYHLQFKRDILIG